jgi:hypothetical protein
MRKRKKTATDNNGLDSLSALFHGLDYGVEPDSFIVYELGRLIEEDRASFEDGEFRNLVEKGIREHLEEQPGVRAELAGRLRSAYSRMTPETRATAQRTVAALEDIELPLRNVAAIVRTYSACLFRKLEDAAGESAKHEDEAARGWIDQWRNGSVSTAEMTSRLEAIGPPAAGSVADLLFDSLEMATGDRAAAEVALDILGRIRSPLSSRVLAHAISEPMLDEALESKAFDLVRAFWPLPRHYMLAALHTHEHEDLPYRWFQLFVEMNEVYAVDLVMEEFAVHGSTPSYQADLIALAGLLQQSRDPEIEAKVLQVLNTPETAPSAVQILQDFLKSWSLPPPLPPGSDPWLRLAHLVAVNRRYVAAAKLFDSGNRLEALRSLDGILRDEPGYPFAVMLKSLVT